MYAVSRIRVAHVRRIASEGTNVELAGRGEKGQLFVVARRSQRIGEVAQGASASSANPPGL